MPKVEFTLADFRGRVVPCCDPAEGFSIRAWRDLAGKVLGPVGFKVVRVDVSNGVIEDFVVNRGDTNGPASRLRSGGLERPVSLRFDPTGESLYIVDFGVMTMTARGASPHQRTGVLWRITRGQP